MSTPSESLGLPRTLFVTGIGTDVGKTVVAAILTKALGADYWKPVQAGIASGTDQATVAALVPEAVCHPEAYRLALPASPHAAAAAEARVLTLAEILAARPVTARPLVIEGAGGVLVPLAPGLLVIDLMQALDVPVVVVSRHYLGSINHTLLTVEALRARRIPIAGLVFNGPATPASESFILNHTGLPLLLAIPEEPAITPEVISRLAPRVTTAS
jgi:dethiobiotin synthetase